MLLLFDFLSESSVLKNPERDFLQVSSLGRPAPPGYGTSPPAAHTEDLKCLA